jgi:hypothetical protein
LRNACCRRGQKWDFDLLREHFIELIEVDFDVELTGFSTGSVPIPDYLLKLGAILRAECEFRLFRFHAARESHSQRFGIHMFVTEH